MGALPMFRTISAVVENPDQTKMFCTLPETLLVRITTEFSVKPNGHSSYRLPRSAEL